MFGVFSFWIFGTMTYLFPRLLGRSWWSTRLCECHYWFSMLGLLVMFVDLTIVGVLQGFSWSTLRPWDDSVRLSIPYWGVRLVAGLAIIAGQICFFVNIYKTYQMPVPAESQETSAAATAS
jgi:cytochrome c oxidase cbb3-type subunit 1